MFEQVLMLLVNLIIRDLNNLETIEIDIKVTGHKLSVSISHTLIKT